MTLPPNNAVITLEKAHLCAFSRVCTQEGSYPSLSANLAQPQHGPRVFICGKEA